MKIINPNARITTASGAVIDTALKDFKFTPHLSDPVERVIDQLRDLSTAVSAEFTATLKAFPRPVRKHKKRRIQKKWLKRYGVRFVAIGTKAD